MKKLLLILTMIFTSQLVYAKSPLLKLPYSLKIGEKPLQSTYDLTNKHKKVKTSTGGTYNIIENRVEYWTNERGEVELVGFEDKEKLPKVFRNAGFILSLHNSSYILKRKGTNCKKVQEILKNEEGFKLVDIIKGGFIVYTYLVDNRLKYEFVCADKITDGYLGLKEIFDIGR